MSPLYTAEEKAEIMRCRELRNSQNEYERIVSRVYLYEHGREACVRSWRRKCAASERRGLEMAASIAGKCVDASMSAEDCYNAIRRAAGETLKENSNA